MKLFTIGFVGKSAKIFFELLKNNGIKSLIDIRLNNTSQLAGFTKKADLQYFLKTICDIEYIYKPELAPNPEIFKEYKKNGMNWDVYEKKFLELVISRQIENLPKDVFDQACLLCSESTPTHCHRRLVAEYLQHKWGDIDIVHL